MRSWISPVVGVDREPLARDPPERHVRGADRVGTQHDLVERIAGRERHVDARRPCPRSTATDALARAPLGVTTSTSRPSAPATSTACSASPTARRSALDRRTGDVDLGPARPHLDAVGASATPAARPRRARRRRRSRRRRRARPRPPRSAGASGRAARRPRARRRRAPCARTGRRARAPRAARPSAPCRRTRRRSRAATPVRRPARTTTRRVRGTRARPTASRAAHHRAGTAASGRAAGRAASTVVRRPCTFAGARPRLEQRLRDDPLQTRGLDRVGAPTRRQRHRDQRVARRGVVGERRAAERHVEIDALRAARLPARRAGAAASRSRAAVATARPSPTASRTVSQPVHRHRCAASARSTSRARVRPRTASRSPACRTRTAIRRSRRTRRPRASRAGSSSPSIVVTARPSTRAIGRHARDARLTVDEHGATAALTLRRAPVLGRHDAEPLAQHVQQRLAPLDVGVDDDRRAVEHERDRRRHRGDRTRRPDPGPDAKRPRRSGAVRQIGT